MTKDAKELDKAAEKFDQNTRSALNKLKILMVFASTKDLSAPF